MLFIITHFLALFLPLHMQFRLFQEDFDGPNVHKYLPEEEYFGPLTPGMSDRALACYRGERVDIFFCAIYFMQSLSSAQFGPTFVEKKDNLSRELMQNIQENHFQIIIYREE